MRYTENWIPEEALPTRSGLIVVRKNDPNHGLSTGEIQDRMEFIHCYLLKDFEVLMMIPMAVPRIDFFVRDFQVPDSGYCAFNTHDYQSQIRPFNKYKYAMTKIMERVKDLAIMHSSISGPEDRLEVRQKYENYINRRFRDRLFNCIEQFKSAFIEERRAWLKHRIAELNRRIMECNRIWERYAPPENWDT